MNIIFEAKGNDGIIVCDGLLSLSRLMNPIDDHTLNVSFYDRKKSANDLKSEGKIAMLAATSTYTEEKITVNFAQSFTQSYKSVIIETNSGESLLIINKGDFTDKIDIYYN